MQIEVYKVTADGDNLTISLEAICDSFSSLLWDIEYYQCGSFEVYIAANPQNIGIFKPGRIIGRDDDNEHFGIIESVKIETDSENGDYGQDGQPISSKTVCCKAQDIGFTGIANINEKYIYTHVDVRTGSKWYGDETKGNSTVTSDFYSYFGVSKNNEPLMKGIDVSVHNGSIDWQKVKNAGIQFAILRAGYGRELSQRDARFEENYRNAKAVNLSVGAYWYSYAMSEDEARLEANVFLSVIKGKQLEMPVYFDLEEKKQFDLVKEKVSAIMRAFLEKVEKAGYFVGLYGSASSLTTHTADDIKTRYTVWLAHWTEQTNYSGDYGIWQYSSEGKVNGINGNVDLDICTTDFPDIIRNKGLNGFDNKQISTPEPDATSANVTVKIGDEIYKGTLIKS